MAKRPKPVKPVIFDDFIPAKVVTLATLLRRATALRFTRLFDISLVEWRIITRVGANPGLSTTQLGDRIGLNKGQVSRVTGGLTNRGLIESMINPHDTRKAMLSLTPEGETLHQALLSAGLARHSQFFEGIDEKELEITNRVLDRLTLRAHELLAAEHELSSGTDGSSTPASPLTDED